MVALGALGDDREDEESVFFPDLVPAVLDSSPLFSLAAAVFALAVEEDEAWG